ncbi:MAG TPA: hypothetical protein VFF71_07730 [Luteimonas sp.]|nr:hypothetical protein [Luteimonas sp.]
MAFHAPREEGQSQAMETGPQDVVVAPSALPSKHLARAGQESPLRETSLPDGWQLRRGSVGVLVDGQGREVIAGAPDAPLVGVEASGDGKWLVHHGSGRYAVYDANGGLVRTVPVFNVPGAGAPMWRWKDSSSLVGVVEVSDEDGQPRYPETDVLPTRTLLVMYPLDEDVDDLYMLDAPEPPAGTVVRLEGVTRQGGLVLSAVVPAEYFGGAPEQALGIYEVE